MAEVGNDVVGTVAVFEKKKIRLKVKTVKIFAVFRQINKLKLYLFSKLKPWSTDYNSDGY